VFITIVAVAGTLLSAGVLGFISSQIAAETTNANKTDVALINMRKKLLVCPLDPSSKRIFLDNVSGMMEYSIPDQLQALQAFPRFYYEHLVTSLFLQYINRCTLFQHLAPLAKEMLCLSCQTFTCSVDQIIVSQGTPDDCFYVLMHGEVQIIGVQPDGLGELKYMRAHSVDDPASAYFGEQSLLFNINSQYKVVASKRCTLACWTRQDMEELRDQFPKDIQLWLTMKKIAMERLELFQQVVQDNVMSGAVTTKCGNALRKILSVKT